MKIAFVTDSTAYLTEEEIREYEITVVPLSVAFKDATYREGVDISAEDYYQKLSDSKELPTTSQPAVGEFVVAFESLLKEHDAVVCYLLSSGLSGTCQSAQTAADMVGGNIVVVDSEIASYGIAGPLLDGVRMAHHGGSLEDVVALWKRIRRTVHAYFVIDTLEYLHRGGRIGGAAAAFGALLQIKPILTMIDGKIELHEKVRTHKRAMEHLLSKFDEMASTGIPMRVGVVHSRRLEDAKQLAIDLSSKYPNIEVGLSELGPVIGTHTGPGVLALLYYPKDEALLQQ